MSSLYIQLMTVIILNSVTTFISSYHTLPIHFNFLRQSWIQKVHVDILHPKSAHVSEVYLNFMYWEIDFFSQAWSLHHAYPDNNTLCPLGRSGWCTSNSLLPVYLIWSFLLVPVTWQKSNFTQLLNLFLKVAVMSFPFIIKPIDYPLFLHLSLYLRIFFHTIHSTFSLNPKHKAKKQIFKLINW